MDGKKEQGYFHHHIQCSSCLREIKEIELETERDFSHKDVSNIISTWKPEGVEWSSQYRVHNIPPGFWGDLTALEQSHHIGRACGFLYGDLKMSSDSRANDMSIFPLSLQNKVFPRSYLEGLLEGLIRASSIHCIYRRSISELKRPREALLGVGLYLISEVSNHPGLISMWRCSAFEQTFQEVPYKVPPSYPLSNKDLGYLGKSFLRHLYITRYVDKKRLDIPYSNIWIFSDINDIRTFGTLAMSSKLMKLLYHKNMAKGAKNTIRSSKDTITCLRDPDRAHDGLSLDFKGMFRLDEEIRHASKAIIKASDYSTLTPLGWTPEAVFPVLSIEVSYVGTLYECDQESPTVEIPRVQNPLVSGLRLFQFATGSHYKVRSILYHFGITYQDAIGGGDGSGGICSMLLRYN